MTLPASGAISALDIQNEFGLPPAALGYGATEVPIREYCWGGYLNYDPKIPDFVGTGTNISYDNFHGAQRNWPVSLPLTISGSNTSGAVNNVSLTINDTGRFWPGVPCNDAPNFYESGVIATISGLKVNYSGLPTTTLTETGGVGSPGLPIGIPLILACSEFTIRHNGTSYRFGASTYSSSGLRVGNTNNVGIRLFDKNGTLVKDVFVGGTSGEATGISTVIPAWTQTLDPAKFPYTLKFRVEAKRQTGQDKCADDPGDWAITSALPVITVGPESYGFISQATSINEGTAATFNIGTLGLPVGTPIYWTVNHTSTLPTVPGEFYSTSGSVVTATDGTATISVTPIPDRTTEGSETFRLELRTGSTAGPIKSISQSVTINDTSLDPTYNFSSVPTTILEGYPGTFTVSTTEVDNGTVLHWTIKTLQSVAADFTATSGSFTITGGQGSFTITPIYDGIGETSEIFQVEIRTTSATGTIRTTSNPVTILNTNYNFTIVPATTWPIGSYANRITNATTEITSSANNVNFGASQGLQRGSAFSWPAGINYVKSGASSDFTLSGDFSVEVYSKASGTSAVFFSQGTTDQPSWSFGITKNNKVHFSWGFVTVENKPESQSPALTLTAPTGTVMTSVALASYGSASNWTTNPRPQFIKGGTSASTSVSKTEDLVIGLNTFTFAVNSYNTYFGDPASGQPKYYSAVISYGLLSTGTITGGGAWNHIAVTRVGSTITIYINGVASGTATKADSIGNSISNQNTWGAHFCSPVVHTQNYNYGWMSNYRLITGTSQYTGNFTPPTVAFTAAAGSYTGTLKSLLFTTSSPTQNLGSSGTLSSVGTISHEASTSPQGILVNGQGDFTVEFWVRFDTVPNAAAEIIFFGSATPNTFRIYKAAGRSSIDYGWTSSTEFAAYTTIIGTASIVASTWYHVAVIRTQGVVETFWNGVQRWYNPDLTVWPTPTSNYFINGKAGATGSFAGYMSNFRYVRGSAVYPTNQGSITVPETPLTAVAGTKLLTYNGGGLVDNSGSNNTLISSSGLAEVTQTVIPFSVATFPGAEGYQVGFQVYAEGTPNGTTLYWTILHSSTVAADFVQNSGSFIVTGGYGEFYITPSADFITDTFQETYQVQVRIISTTGTVVATSSAISVFDTTNPNTLFNVTIANNIDLTQQSLYTWLRNNTQWDGIKRPVITVNAGVRVYNQIRTEAALKIGQTSGSTHFPNGVTIINNGYIYGKGGASLYSGDPEPGGAAIKIMQPSVAIINNAGGFIAGGGGGGRPGGQGGGGGGAGGGQGAPQGAGVNGGIGNPTGTGNTGTGARTGGGGGSNFPGTGGSAPGAIGQGGGAGGGGGGPGGGAGGGSNNAGGAGSGPAPTGGGGGGGGGWGAAGGTSVQVGPGLPLAGGAGGNAIEGTAYGLTLTNNGTIWGAQVV